MQVQVLMLKDGGVQAPAAQDVTRINHVVTLLYKVGRSTPGGQLQRQPIDRTDAATAPTHQAARAAPWRARVEIFGDAHSLVAPNQGVRRRCVDVRPMEGAGAAPSGAPAEQRPLARAEESAGAGTSDNNTHASSFSNLFRLNESLFAGATTAVSYGESSNGTNNGPFASIGPGGFWAKHSALVAAARSGDTATIDALLAAGLSPDEGSSVLLGSIAAYSALGEAAAAGRTAAVEALLRGGADPNLGTRYGPLGWCSSLSPLAAAANGGHTDAVRALLRAGANANEGADEPRPAASS